MLSNIVIIQLLFGNNNQSILRWIIIDNIMSHSIATIDHFDLVFYAKIYVNVMRNLETFNWIFKEFDKKLKLQTNFTDVYESSKFDRKVISFRIIRLKGNLRHTD